MKITVIGGGYVGLIAAVCFCEFGFEVGVVDLSEEKIKNLKNNFINIFEPGIEESIKKFRQSNSLKFSTDISDFFYDSDVVVIAVQTLGKNGEDSDLSFLHDAINDICSNLRKDKYTAIIIRTSVPVGTCSIINNNIKFLRPDLTQGEHYDIITIPGFTREGSAIFDFMSPERVVIGLDRESKNAKRIIEELYKTIIASKTPFVYTNFETAELIRYVSTGLVVTKIAFLNELIPLCERASVNIDDLIKGISLDSRIGKKALRVCPGFGGASYPRSVRILKKTAETFGVDLKILTGAIKSNESMLDEVFEKIYNKIKDSQNTSSTKNICIFGLSFKPKTNDIRESPSIYVIRKLLENGINISSYDPLFLPDSNIVSLIPDDIKNSERFCLSNSPYEAVTQQDLLVIMTDWMDFRSLDYKKIAELMNKNEQNKPVLMDFRNMFSSAEMKDFEYISQGNHQ